MAHLATKPYLVASLNVMVAARQHSRPDQAFSNDEIVGILMAMAENEAIAAHRQSDRTKTWHHGPTKLI